MKYVIFAIVIAAGAYFFPQIYQSKGGPCQALEAKVVNEVRGSNPEAGALAGIVSGLSNGEIGRKIANQDYPSLPTPLGCVLSYYLKNPREISIKINGSCPQVVLTFTLPILSLQRDTGILHSFLRVCRNVLRCGGSV